MIGIVKANPMDHQVRQQNAPIRPAANVLMSAVATMA
jgi:hypothetical protein